MTTDMSVIPNMFEGAPWRFEAEASPEERREQADFIAGLNARDRFSVAGGGYLSPEAYWLAESLILGPGCLVASGVRVDGEVTAGRRCSFNLNSTVAGKVTMGDDVRIAAGAGVWGFNHAYDDPDRPIIEQGIETRGITLGDDVWIGANAVVTDGVTIGSHTIVAAGAVVTRDVPAFSVVAGNPARVVRDRRAPRKSDLDGLRDALKILSDKAARDWPAILAHHRTDARPGYHYSDPRNDADNPIRPDCDAVQIAAMFDAVPDALTKAEWIAHFAGRQDPAMGLYRRDTDTPMPSKPKSLKPDAVHTYDVLCVSYALECLGSAPNHRIAWADLVLPEIEAHLADLPWTREGWHCGALLDHLGTAAYVNARYFGGQSGLDGLFGALLRRCDAKTGLWSPETDGDLLQAVNGFYRLTRGTYAQFGLPLPYAEQAIDTMIGYTARHDFFAGEGRTACNVLDIVHPLMLAAQSSSHRAEERDRTILKTLKGIDAQWADGRGFAFCADEEPSLQGTEMWLSIAALAALHFDLGDQIGFGLRGIHRFEPAVDLRIRAQV